MEICGDGHGESNTGSDNDGMELEDSGVSTLTMEASTSLKNEVGNGGEWGVKGAVACVNLRRSVTQFG